MGVTFRRINNLPIGQFYGITVDNRGPVLDLRRHAGTTIPGWDRPRPRSWEGIVGDEWRQTGFGDGMYQQADPDGRTIYINTQNGGWTRFDNVTGDMMSLRLGAPEGEEPYRWDWVSPSLVLEARPERGLPGRQSSLHFARPGRQLHPHRGPHAAPGSRLAGDHGRARRRHRTLTQRRHLLVRRDRDDLRVAAGPGRALGGHRRRQRSGPRPTAAAPGTRSPAARPALPTAPMSAGSSRRPKRAGPPTSRSTPTATATFGRTSTAPRTSGPCGRRCTTVCRPGRPT